jgi:hypothetical protein
VEIRTRDPQNKEALIAAFKGRSSENRSSRMGFIDEYIWRGAIGSAYIKCSLFSDCMGALMSMSVYNKDLTDRATAAAKSKKDSRSSGNRLLEIGSGCGDRLTARFGSRREII